MEARLEVAADAIEMQCCVEIRPTGTMQGVVRPIALVAREKQGAAPVLLAARKLVDAVGEGDAVVIATGFPVPGFLPAGETDGPPGAACLAHALSLGLGAVPVLLGEETTVGPIRAACRAIGMVESGVDSIRGRDYRFAADTFPTDDTAAARADELLEALRPKAIVVTEKPGLNAKGVAHRGGGRSIDSGRARIEVLTGRAREIGIPTIAIGDNGNEAGMGLIADAVRAHKPYGAVCLCPCQGGIAAVDEADVTVVGSVSNWAAYGIAACLAILLSDERLLHDGETERRMIEECLRAGAVDGVTCTYRQMVDAIPARINGYVVDILRTLVTTAIGKSC